MLKVYNYWMLLLKCEAMNEKALSCVENKVSFVFQGFLNTIKCTMYCKWRNFTEHIIICSNFTEHVYVFPEREKWKSSTLSAPNSVIPQIL